MQTRGAALPAPVPQQRAYPTRREIRLGSEATRGRAWTPQSASDADQLLLVGYPKGMLIA